MQTTTTVGVNLDTRRSLPRTDPRLAALPRGGEGFAFRYRGAERTLPVRSDWGLICPGWTEGRLHVAALALHQACWGCPPHRAAGRDWLRRSAETQLACGAGALLVNVDGLGSLPEKRDEAMGWLAGFLAETYSRPLWLESDRAATLQAGLDAVGGRVSVTLVGPAAEDLVPTTDADIVFACPAGAPEERIAAASQLVEMREGREDEEARFLLALPIASVTADAGSGEQAIRTAELARDRLPGLRIAARATAVAGELPHAGVLVQRLAARLRDAGVGARLLDPVATQPGALDALDAEDEAVRAADAVLAGRDPGAREYLRIVSRDPVGAEK